MDQGLKERLIGAAVLVALGVWLIPWLLDGRQEQVELETSSTAVRLPAPDGPLPLRTQTLSVESQKSEPASEPHLDAAELAPAAAPTPAAAPAPTPAVAAAETAVAVAEPTLPPTPAPETSPAPKQPPPAKAALDHGAAPRVAAAAPPPATSGKPAQKPATATAQTPAARGDWAVQLGSFGAEDNAKKLAQKVNVYGYKPEVATVRSSGRAMYRVRLGPYRSRAEADAAASAVSAHGFPAQVVAAD